MTAGPHLVMTGPISGTVTLPDGSVVDVTPAFIEVESPEQARAVSDAIGARHVAVKPNGPAYKVMVRVS